MLSYYIFWTSLWCQSRIRLPRFRTRTAPCSTSFISRYLEDLSCYLPRVPVFDWLLALNCPRESPCYWWFYRLSPKFWGAFYLNWYQTWTVRRCNCTFCRFQNSIERDSPLELSYVLVSLRFLSTWTHS